MRWIFATIQTLLAIWVLHVNGRHGWEYWLFLELNWPSVFAIAFFAVAIGPYSRFDLVDFYVGRLNPNVYLIAVFLLWFWIGSLLERIIYRQVRAPLRLPRVVKTGLLAIGCAIALTSGVVGLVLLINPVTGSVQPLIAAIVFALFVLLWSVLCGCICFIRLIEVMRSPDIRVQR